MSEIVKFRDQTPERLASEIESAIKLLRADGYSGCVALIEHLATLTTTPQVVETVEEFRALDGDAWVRLANGQAGMARHALIWHGDYGNLPSGALPATVIGHDSAIEEPLYRWQFTNDRSARLAGAVDVHPTSDVLAEVRALPHAVPVDLWCTYGGADRETVEGFKDWLQERIDAILDREAGR